LSIASKRPSPGGTVLSVTDVKGRAAVIAKNCPATGTATVKLSPVSVTTEILPPIKTPRC